MTCTNSIHVADEGTVFEVTITDCDENGDAVVVDLSTATVIEFVFVLPSLRVKRRTGTVSTPPGTDGKCRYVAAPGDLSEAGTWKLQVRVGFPSGVWRTEETTFPVELPIEPLHYFDPETGAATAAAPIVAAS